MTSKCQSLNLHDRIRRWRFSRKSAPERLPKPQFVLTRNSRDSQGCDGSSLADIRQGITRNPPQRTLKKKWHFGWFCLEHKRELVNTVRGTMATIEKRTEKVSSPH